MNNSLSVNKELPICTALYEQEDGIFSSKPHATNYKVHIHSFDDDYYYGAFLRTHSDVTKEFLANLYLDFDDQDENFPHSYLYFMNPYQIERQTFIDFENEEECQHALEDQLSAIVMQSAKQIFQAVKKEGKTITLIVA